MSQVQPTDTDFLEGMLLIRRVEEKLLELFSQGKINGTTHTSIGQEASAVGIMAALDCSRDIVFSNHRCHGHFLAYGGPLVQLLGEVMGKQPGACAGIGGSQHLHYHNFYSNGVLGGIAPAAVGMAFAEKIKGTGAITCVFIGDGALGEGVVYESFNIAALWRLPILFVIEANGMAQSTPTEHEHAGRLSDRPKAFSILTEEWPVSGPRQVYDRIKSLADAIRQDSKPRCAVLHTFRLGPHSKGDDTREAYLLTAAAKRDPLNLALAQSGGLAITLEERVQATLTQALQQVEAAEGLNPEVYLRMGV